MIMTIIPIDVTLEGIVTELSAEQSWKAPIPIILTLGGIVILTIEHAAYWKSVMLTELVGTMTDVKAVSVYRFMPATV